MTRRDDGRWELFGRGVGGLAEPEDVLDMGNAGTGVRLLMGLVASHPFTTMFTGDASLRSRPMRRVTEPLGRMGAGFVGRAGGRLPMAVIGTRFAHSDFLRASGPSAQVKSAVLLAGLEHAGHHHGDRARADPRPHRTACSRAFGADVTVEALAAWRAGDQSHRASPN